MDNKMIAHEWFRYATQDLSSANYLRSIPSSDNATACRMENSPGIPW
ncbi:hypothetical protein [Pelosinus baikalensis]|uniref:Uncharacterized protein n=1 Tax=Pelosinus baikalensis TaxID=2892015 RepID=A0ABS8HYM4_9FIRM|nr:hypothetical protein [Pelosinus baikalensis]MCC5468292.1 hypothetical protein [Pelosinus baikalensis]